MVVGAFLKHHHTKNNKMKQLLSALFISILAFSAAHAQEIRLNGFAGYVFDDRVDAYASNTSYYEGTVKGGFRWGAELEYHTGVLQATLSRSHQAVRASLGPAPTAGASP